MPPLHRTLSTVARVLLGLAFFVFGLNGFLHFLPMPPPPPAAAGFVGAMLATGYFFPLVAGTETVAGALLLAGRFVPLALLLLAPLLVNIVAFHLFLEPPSTLAMPLVLVALTVYLAWCHRASFAPILRARAVPAPAVLASTVAAPLPGAPATLSVARH